MRDTADYCVFVLLCPQERRTVAIARPLEINETEKALRAAIKDVLVCISPIRSQFESPILPSFFEIHMRP